MIRKSTGYLTSIRLQIIDSQEDIHDHIAELECDLQLLESKPLTDINEQSKEWDTILAEMQERVTLMQRSVTNIKRETKKYREFFV